MHNRLYAVAAGWLERVLVRLVSRRRKSEQDNGRHATAATALIPVGRLFFDHSSTISPTANSTAAEETKPVQ